MAFFSLCELKFLQSFESRFFEVKLAGLIDLNSNILSLFFCLNSLQLPIMPKPIKPLPTKLPPERNIRTRSRTLRKKSTDDPFENHPKSFLEESYLPYKDYSTVQAKQKYFPHHQEADIFACIDDSIKNQLLEKESMLEKHFKEYKKPNILVYKPEIFYEAAESQVKQSLVNVEEANESEKQNFDQESPESPIFGTKMMKNLRTPPNKLVDLRDFDQSEEIVRKNFIDQFEDVSKEASSPSDNRQSSLIQSNPIEFSSPAFKTEKRISKQRMTPESKKKPFHDVKLQRLDDVEFSFKRHGTNDEVKRRSQILRMTVLKSIYTKYDKSERILISLENAMKTLMNYYNLRQLNAKVLGFRKNVFKLCKEEIDKILESIREKKEICIETIQEKQKNESGPYIDEKMDGEEL